MEFSLTERAFNCAKIVPLHWHTNAVWSSSWRRMVSLLQWNRIWWIWWTTESLTIYAHIAIITCEWFASFRMTNSACSSDVLLFRWNVLFISRATTARCMIFYILIVEQIVIDSCNIRWTWISIVFWLFNTRRWTDAIDACLLNNRSKYSQQKFRILIEIVFQIYRQWNPRLLNGMDC